MFFQKFQKPTFCGKLQPLWLPKYFYKKIKKEFPEIKWEKARFVTHGFDHLIVVLDNKLIFRTPKKTSDNLQNELYNETQLLGYLKNKVQVGIPEYSYIFKDKSAAGYKMVAGQELKPAIFKKLLIFEKEKIANQLADFITVLHTTPKSIIKKYRVKIEDDQKRYSELVREAKKHIFPKLNESEIEIIKQYFVELKTALGYQYPKTLIHNDLTQAHILWDKKKKQINVIDFSDRVFGDPALDFAGLLEYGKEFTEQVLALYQGKKDKQMLHRAQLYAKRIPLFLMKDAEQGFPCAFEDGYRMFKKRFGI